jgi:phosphatidylglycerophosphate synthase
VTAAPATIADRSALRTIVDELGRRQKPGDGVPAYTRWVNRRLARYPAAAAYRLGLSANAVTAASVLASAAAIALIAIAPVTAPVGIAAAVLLAAGFVLDSADGQVARLARTGGPAGEWLDHVVDAIRTPAIHLAVLAGFWRLGAPPLVLLVPVLFAVLGVGQFMSQILAEQLTRSSVLATGRDAGAGLGTGATATGGRRRSWLLLPTDTGVTCWMFVLWGFPPLFLGFYAVLAAGTIVHVTVSMRRRYRSLQALTPRPGS